MREAMFEELLVRYEQRLRRRTETAAIQLDLDVSDEGHTTLSYAQLRSLAAAPADDASAATVVEALRFLHENAFHPEAEETGNWWHWEIGTPRILLDICVLLRAQHPGRRSEAVSGDSATLLSGPRPPGQDRTVVATYGDRGEPR